MIKHNFIAMLFFTSVSLIQSAEEKPGYVYSHGFGESASINDSKIYCNKVYGIDNIVIPEYPDAPRQIGKAVFYTKPAVHVLADALKKQVDSGITQLHIIGQSCGGGTLVNCLAKLNEFEKNATYFEGTAIKKEDAQKIISAVNKGSLVFDAPFLALRKWDHIARSSKLLSIGTVIGCMLATSYFLPYLVASKIGFAAACYATHKIARNPLKVLWGSAITWIALPLVTHRYFNPAHITPLDAATTLKGKLTCPMLFHFHANDRVLENPDSDTAAFCSALGNEKTYICISNDGWHILPSNHYQKILDYWNKYLYLNTEQNTLKKNTLTPQQFSQQINSWRRWLLSL